MNKRVCFMGAERLLVFIADGVVLFIFMMSPVMWLESTGWVGEF